MGVASEIIYLISLLSFPSDFCVQRLTEEMRVSIYYLCCLCLSLAHKKEFRHDIVSEMWLYDWGLSKNFRYVHVLLTHSMNFIHLFFIRLTRLQDSNTVAHSKQPTHTDIFLLRKYMLNYCTYPSTIHGKLTHTQCFCFGMRHHVQL